MISKREFQKIKNWGGVMSTIGKNPYNLRERVRVFCFAD